jgi:hypothetical protein
MKNLHKMSSKQNGTVANVSQYHNNLVAISSVYIFPLFVRPAFIQSTAFSKILFLAKIFSQKRFWKSALFFSGTGGDEMWDKANITKTYLFEK